MSAIGVAVDVATLLQANPVALSTERQAQDAIESILADASGDRWGVIREYRVDARSRVDFALETVFGLVGIEVKINSGQRREIWRQIERYAKTGRFSAIVLATNRAMTMPHSAQGVPLVVSYLGRAWL